jgi:hypothetical protein
MAETQSEILILVGAFTPAYKAGGAVRSVANLVSVFGDEFRFRIVTRDRDLGDKVAFPGIKSNRWVWVGKANVLYLCPGIREFFRIWSVLRSVDAGTVLYLNSFFARRYSMLAAFMRWVKLCRPRSVVLAPRGEFSPGALQFKSRQKRLYVQLAERLGLYSGIIWHASSAVEEEDIRRVFPRTQWGSLAGILADGRGSIGWDLSLADTEGFRLALQQCIDGDNEWFTSISARAMFYAAQRASDPKVIEDNRRLFQAASGLVLASSTVSESSSAF